MDAYEFLFNRPCIRYDPTNRDALERKLEWDHFEFTHRIRWVRRWERRESAS